MRPQIEHYSVQVDGEMGIVDYYLKTEPANCANCDVYEWKQVKDTESYL